MRAPLVFFVTLVVAARAFGAACCGGASAAPTLITGDDLAQVSASLAYSRVIGDAPADGIAVFRAGDDREILATGKVDGAYLFADRWQLGFSLPYSQRRRETRSLNYVAHGFGDLTLDLAYELVPEWDYSPLKPHLFVFGGGVFPTGTSIYDFENVLAADAMGRGFYGVNAGALAMKSWGHWDANALLELHRAFRRTFGDLRVTPGFGGTLLLGGGYNLGQFRFGASLAPIYEDPIDTETGGIASRSTYKLAWSSAVQVSYMPADDLSISLTYTDQTLVGPAVNVALNRSLALLFQKRWPR